MSKKKTIAFTLFTIAIVSRIIPHAHNFTPIEAIALFGGAYLGRKYLPLIITISALYLTDLLLNNTLLRSYFPGEEGMIWFSPYMIWNYLSLFLIVGIGTYLLKNKKRKHVGYVLGAAVASSFVFFLITNFGSWVSSPLYAKDLSGLMASYIAGIPFYKMTFLSNLLFTSVFFGSMYLVDRGDAIEESIA